MVCYTNKILQIGGDRVILKKKEFPQKVAILLLKTTNRPRLLLSNGPNMGFYCQNYIPGVSRKPLDH